MFDSKRDASEYHNEAQVGEAMRRAIAANAEAAAANGHHDDHRAALGVDTREGVAISTKVRPADLGVIITGGV